MQRLSQESLFCIAQFLQPDIKSLIKWESTCTHIMSCLYNSQEAQELIWKPTCEHFFSPFTLQSLVIHFKQITYHQLLTACFKDATIAHEAWVKSRWKESYFETENGDILANFCICGKWGAGKTTICKTFMVNGTLTNKCLEHELFVKNIQMKEAKFKLHMMDTSLNAKQVEKNKFLHCKQFHVVFLVFDVSDRDSWQQISQWFETICTYCDAFVQLVGNKKDKTRVVTKKEIAEFQRQKQHRIIGYHETSVAEPPTVQVLFEKSLRFVWDRVGSNQVAKSRRNTTCIIS